MRGGVYNSGLESGADVTLAMGDKNQSGGSITIHNSGECGMFRDCNFLPIYLSLRLCYFKNSFNNEGGEDGM